ncbi:MAG: Crp/Fnr family transcriptional regulator [Christensenellales bacterium]
MAYAGELTDYALFAGMAASEMPQLLHCLGARRLYWQKDAWILRAGDQPGALGLILKGSASVLREDYWGNRTLIQKLAAGDVFAESFALAGAPGLPVSVLATDATEVLYLDVSGVLSPCALGCAFHTRLIVNIARLLAEKNIALTRKIEHLAMRSTREKLLSYLSGESQRAGSDSFVIPFSRQELADYLCVDRSAMSAALGRLRREGTIDFSRSHFRVLRAQGL